MQSETGSVQGIAPDLSGYPRAYPASPAWRLFFTFLGIAVGAGLPYMILTVSGRGISISGSPSILWLLPFPLVGIYWILWVRRFKVTLQPDAIELRRFFSTRRLTRSEIKERRFVLNRVYMRPGLPAQLVLVPRNGKAKELQILMIIDNDDLFHAWFKAIPDADKQRQAYR